MPPAAEQQAATGCSRGVAHAARMRSRGGVRETGLMQRIPAFAGWGSQREVGPLHHGERTWRSCVARAFAAIHRLKSSGESEVAWRCSGRRPRRSRSTPSTAVASRRSPLAMEPAPSARCGLLRRG
jgi:hypothetical protein